MIKIKAADLKSKEVILVLHYVTWNFIETFFYFLILLVYKFFFSELYLDSSYKFVKYQLIQSMCLIIPCA